MRRDVFQAIADQASHLEFNCVASNHIKILTECQLLEKEQTGREIYCHFNPQKMKEVDLWVATFRKT